MRTLAIALTVLFVAGCGGGGGDNPGNLDNVEFQVSECGGFEANQPAPMPAPLPAPAPADYCAAEVLNWSYSADTGRLDLLNTRVFLNCCGDHSVRMDLVDGVLTVLELDKPEFGDARCDCMCVFDFQASAVGVPAGELAVELWRHETDQTADPVLVWQGTLDTAAGGGDEIVSEEDLGMWCGEGDL